MYPAEEAELLLELTLLQRHNEANEAERVEHEAEHAMIGREGQKIRVSEDDMLRWGMSMQTFERRGRTYLEVVDNALAVEEVIRHREEVPVEGLAPRIPAPFLVLVGRLTLQGEESRDFAVNDHLAHKYEENHVGVTHEKETCLTVSVSAKPNVVKTHQ